MSDPADYDAHLVRGALVNIVGLIAKLVHPLFFVVVTWLFGPELVGLYFLAVFIADIATTAAASGFADATLIFASHDADSAQKGAADSDAASRLYRVLGNGFAVGVGSSTILVPALYFGAGALVTHFYPDRPGLESALHILAWSIPLTALPQIAIAATKARMLMQYDAFIMGFARPLCLLGFSLIAWALDAGVDGLMWAQVGAQAVVSALSIGALAKHFDLRRVLRNTFKPHFDRRLLRFAIPQSMNMTANRYLTRLDVFMLAAYGYSNAQIAFYAAAAIITSNLREVKLVFSQALAPVAARHHASGDAQAFEDTLGRVSRWTTTLAIPLILLAVIHRSDLIQLVDSSYTGDTTFMAILLIPPFLSCAFGLAGNSIIYCGHSSWTLLNSLLVSGLNTGFNLWLVPRHGLLGAAIATAMAASLISLLQLIELSYLEGIKLRLRHVWKPHLALGVLSVVLLVLWDPAEFGGVLHRIALTAGLIAGYLVLLFMLRHQELLSLVGRLRRRLGWGALPR